MAGLLAGTAYVDIKPRLDGSFGTKLRSELGAVTKSLSDFTSKDLAGSFRGLGSSLGSLGGSLTKNLSVPLIGAGVVAAKFAMDFGREMANVATLIPGTTGRVDELAGAIQSMAVEVGTSTSDLTGGLYQVISAFGDTADTVKILEVNAKAAKAGVASTTDAINLTSAVTKSYGDTSAEAVTHVADLALKTVELGQTTFPELAGSIGLVTPLASSLGVTVEDLFGTMSTFTGVTGSASEVATQLRGVLQSFLAPTESMTVLFDQLGVSSGKAMIEQYGLSGATQLVADAASKNGKPLTDYIMSIEGVTLALAGTGGQADTWKEKVAQMGDTAGTLDEKFKILTTGVGEAGFSFDQAKAGAEVAAQKLGEALAPAIGVVVRDLAPLVVNVGEFTAALLTADGWMGTAARTLGVVAVAAGPTIWAVGKITSGIGSMIGTVKGVGGGFLAFERGLRGVTTEEVGFNAGLQRTVGALGAGGLLTVVALAGAAIGGWVVAHQRAAEQEREHQARIGDLTDAIRQQNGVVGENTQAWLSSTLLDPSNDMGRAFARTLSDMGLTVDDLEAALSAGGSELDRFAKKVSTHAKEMGETDLAPGGIDVLAEILPKVGKEWAAAGDAAKTAGKVTGEAGDKTKDAGDKAADGAGGTEKMTRALGRVGKAAETAQDSVDRFQNAIDSLLGLQLDAQSAEIRWRDSLIDLAKTIKDNGNTLDMNTEKGRANRSAMIDSTQAALTWADAIVSETGKTDAASLAIAANASSLVDVATQAGLSGDAALTYAEDILGIPADARTNIHSNADLAKVTVEEYQARLNETNGRVVDVTMTINGQRPVMNPDGSLHLPGGITLNTADKSGWMGGRSAVDVAADTVDTAQAAVDTAQAALDAQTPTPLSPGIHLTPAQIAASSQVDTANQQLADAQAAHDAAVARQERLDAQQARIDARIAAGGAFAGGIGETIDQAQARREFADIRERFANRDAVELEWAKARQAFEEARAQSDAGTLSHPDYQAARQTRDDARTKYQAEHVTNQEFATAALARIQQQTEFDDAMSAMSEQGLKVFRRNARKAGLTKAEIDRLVAMVPEGQFDAGGTGSHGKSGAGGKQDARTGKATGDGSSRVAVHIDTINAWNAREAAKMLRHELEWSELVGGRA